MPDKPDAQSADAPATDAGEVTPEADAARLAWVEAYREAHRQLVEMQRAFQRAMTDAHLAFLKAMEASLAGLASFDDLAEPTAEQAAEESPAPSDKSDKSDKSDRSDRSDPSDRSDAPEIRPPKTERVRPVCTRFVVHAERAAPVGLALSGLATAARVAVVDEGTDLAQALAEQLQARGVAAEKVAGVPADAAAVVFLGGLRPVATPAEILDVHRAAFRAARAVAPRFTTGRGVFVTVQDTGGDFGLSGRAGARAGLAGLAGLARTARREWPGVTVKAIDLERRSRPAWKLAKVLAEELFIGGPELEVGLLAEGGRVVLRSAPAPLDLRARGRAPDRGVLGGSSLLVAAGGAQGMTAAALLALARFARPRLLILGRAPDETGRAEIDRAEIDRNLAALRQAGSEVRHGDVDAGDRDAVAQALADVRRDWGPITGLVYGAGPPAESRLIAAGDEETFERRLAARIGGLRNLLEATAEDPLDLLLLFASAAAQAGGRGGAADAVAAEALNRMAAAERAWRGGGCLVKALNWSSSESGTPDPGTAESAARQLVEEVRAAVPDQVEVILGAASRGAEDPRTGSRPMLTMDVFVSAATHPFLEGYRVDGAVALPLVLVLEWFSRIARAHCEDLEMIVCRELRELRSTRLKGFYDAGDAFTVVSYRDHHRGGLELRLELYDRGGRCCASAAAALARPGTTVTASAEAARLIRAVQTAEAHPWPFAAVYGQALERGPELQVIREIEGVSDHGIAAVVAGAREMGWIDGWHTDVAALEGGLQLAVLWFRHQLGGLATATGVGAYLSHFSGLVEGPIRAILRGRNDRIDHVTCDVVFVNENGTLMAELRGVEARAHERRAEPAELPIELELEAEAEVGADRAMAEEEP